MPHTTSNPSASTVHPLPRWPEPKVVVTEIDSSTWFSNIPEACTIGAIGNVIPPMAIDDFKAMLLAFLDEMRSTIPALAQRPPVVEWGPLEMGDYSIEESSDFYQTLYRSHAAYFGTPLQPRYIGGWGDMRLVGSPNLIFYGPGGGGNDHNYDEYYELADLAPTLRTLCQLVTDWCGVASESGSSF